LLPLSTTKLSTLKLDELLSLLDKIESLERSLDFPMREGISSKDEKVISNSLSVLRSLSQISTLSKRKLSA